MFVIAHFISDVSHPFCSRLPRASGHVQVDTLSTIIIMITISFSRAQVCRVSLKQILFFGVLQDWRAIVHFLKIMVAARTESLASRCSEQKGDASEMKWGIRNITESHVVCTSFNRAYTACNVINGLSSGHLSSQILAWSARADTFLDRQSAMTLPFPRIWAIV